jgi:hypothetical protein
VNTLTYAAPWQECLAAEKLIFNEELTKEISPEHALFGVQFDAIARRSGSLTIGTQILFHLKESVFDCVVVHLTFAGEIINNDLPDVEFYISEEEWKERCMKCPWC